MSAFTFRNPPICPLLQPYCWQLCGHLSSPPAQLPLKPVARPLRHATPSLWVAPSPYSKQWSRYWHRTEISTALVWSCLQEHTPSPPRHCSQLSWQAFSLWEWVRMSLWAVTTLWPLTTRGTLSSWSQWSCRTSTLRAVPDHWGWTPSQTWRSETAPSGQLHRVTKWNNTKRLILYIVMLSRYSQTSNKLINTHPLLYRFFSEIYLQCPLKRVHDIIDKIFNKQFTIILFESVHFS